MLRKLIKIGLVLGLLGALAVAAAAGVAWVIGPPVQEGYDPEAFEPAQAEGDAVAGRRLAALLCHRCHYDVETGAFTGRSLAPEYRELGRAYASNITGERNRGIGDWSDGALTMYLRTGVHPVRNELSPPYMPHLPNIADVDLDNLIAFMRSDDPWVKGQRVADEPSEMTYASVVRSWLTWSPGPQGNPTVPRPADSEPIALGAYLANDLLQCHGCHSASLASAKWLEPADSAGFYAGGGGVVALNGKVYIGSNLTPSETGLGAWTYEQFRRALTEGFDPEGRPIRWPMPMYPELTDSELEAMFAYFKTLEPSDRELSKGYRRRPTPPIVDRGRHVYEREACIVCHPNERAGLKSLDGIVETFPDDVALRAYIANPQSKTPGARMPAYGEHLSSEDMDALVEYVRRRAEKGPFAAPPMRDF